MDHDIEKGPVSSKPHSDGTDSKALQPRRQPINGELESTSRSDELGNNIQTQDFAPPARPSSPAYAWRSSVNDLHDDGTAPRAPSPVYGQRYSLEHGHDETPVPRPSSPVYGRRTSMDSRHRNSHDLVSDPRSPSPVYGQRPSFGSQSGNERDGDRASGHRPSSPVYGLRPSLESQGNSIARNDGLPPLEKHITSSFDGGPRPTFEVIEVNPIAGPASSAPILGLPSERQLDFSWIVRHHNKELVAPIQLRTPPKRTQFLESVKEWRPWQAKKPSPAPGVARGGGWHREETELSFRISIAELHRIRLRKLQCKLVNHAWYMKQHSKEPPSQASSDGINTTWEDDLQEYTKALQDYDYMTKCSTQPRDSFLVSGERKVDDYVMREIIGVQMPAAEQRHNPIPVVGPWEEDNQPIGGTRNENVEKSWMKAFEKRLVMAALGGTFLVGPMWLMVLLGDQWFYTTLVSTTVFVYAFGMLMSVLLEKPMDVLSGTAAYAAVMVVFVGFQLAPDSVTAGAQAQVIGGAGNGTGV
ncbi:hypothetical protein V8F33_007989 [Rhypophila sp. PSN 637]